MGGRELLARRDVDFDPGTVEIDDADVLELLDPVVREWWVDQFGAYVPSNGGFFTPPQKEAIPLIHAGENALVCSPTGSGKCVTPDTPLIVQRDGTATVLQAGALDKRCGNRITETADGGELYESEFEAYSLDERSGDTVRRQSMVYTEPYNGTLNWIETEYGRSVEVTPDHPLLVETPNGVEWRRSDEITEGDKVGVPGEIDLPAEPIPLDVTAAIDVLRSRFPVVLTREDGLQLQQAVCNASTAADLSETQRREALALTGNSFKTVAERLDIGISTVHRQLTGEADYRSEALLELFEAELDVPDECELVVKSDGGQISRFRYPTEVTEPVARIAAFVLAEGFVGEHEPGGMVCISQSLRTDLLRRVRTDMRAQFGVQFEQRNELDHAINNVAFAVFFSELLGIDPGPRRSVRFPKWVLNAPERIKRVFVSTFLSLEAEIREDEVSIVQANETKIEQLNYLLLSFGILSARNVRKKAATNTSEETEREYYELAIYEKDSLASLLSAFEIDHPKADEVAAYADEGVRGGNHVGKHRFDYTDIRSLSTYYADDEEFNERLGNVYEVVRRTGYITSQSLDKLAAELDRLPDDGPAGELAERVEQIRSQNVVWLSVRDIETVAYEGKIVDLSVPDTHNYVGGRGGLYMHNTLASFTGIINELFARDRAAGLDNSVYCLYISPLKSLANDIHRNLEVPLAEITDRLDDRGEEVEIRHAIRHGDTDDSERQAMLETTPHILNTTPETLAILLNSPTFKKKLETVEYVIVDEIHSLAENKRGTHLAVSLERLEAMCEGSPTRIGCSATVEPLETVAEFLVGCETLDEDGEAGKPPAPRDYEIVDTRFVREFDVELWCPTDDLINTPRGVINGRFYDQLHELIDNHTNTLVFTNTRSGAERVLHNLREGYGYDEADSGCHHGSLSKDRRQAIEQQLKAGELDVVTTSTSLELGIDMPHLDLVVQVGSPKSVAALLQRIGRAGHQLGETVTGRVIALDRDELIECAVMLRKAQEGFVDRVFVPENAQDVATQHVYGMAINGPRREAEIRRILRRAYPYREYDDAAFEQLLAYLTADYEGLAEKNVYAKVWRDTNDPPDGEHHYETFPVGEELIGKRGRLARVIYMTNIGTIPDSFSCDVFTRGSDEWVGQLDEEYLDTLETGDVFVLGGDRFEFRYRRGSKVYVDRTAARPTVPSWFSERLPLSYDLGREVLTFQREALARLDSGGPSELRVWLREFPLNDNSVRAIARTLDEQVRYLGPEGLSTDHRLTIEEELDREEYRRNYYVHSNYGRRFNDGFSRLLAYRVAREANANVRVAVADNGFTLSMPLNRKVDLVGIVRRIDPTDVRADLRASLDGTDLLKRYFRINATRALMILKRYKGHEKSASQQQVNSDMLLGFAEDLENFAVVEETYREILEDKLNVAGIQTVLAEIQAGAVEVTSSRVDSPSPRAFGLATLMASDVVLAEDESQVLQTFHQRVIETIEGRRSGDSDAVVSE